MSANPATRAARLAAVVVLALVAREARGANPPPVREVLPGGLELVVFHVPGARTSSLRYVVRAGSAHDPIGKEGLAHLLEHLVVRGDGPPAAGFLAAARERGAMVNAFTSRDSTMYVLDAPTAAFEELAGRYLRTVTSPPLERIDVERELAVVAREDAHRAGEGAAALELVSDVLFRGRIEGTTLGATVTRDRITRADLVSFFQRNYSTAATTVIFAGAVTADAARALVDRAVLIPPALPSERPSGEAMNPNLPANERIRTPFLAAVFGYRLDARDRDTCPALAELLELRLRVALTVREPLLRSVETGCFTLRGTDFLFAFGYAPTIEASDLPDQIERRFREAATRPPDSGERRILELRTSRLDDRLRENPPALADAAARAAMHPGPGGTLTLPLSSAPALPVDALRAVARRAFTPERRVLVFLSPFEG